MDAPRIADLLSPYLREPLPTAQLAQVSTYLDLLICWNGKTNLTAVRDPEAMITRHFGESFFVAQQLVTEEIPQTAFDLGSGAGFPGLPLAIYAPEISVTLIESNNKKATFLKEVVRTLALKNVSVLAERGEALRGKAAGKTSGKTTANLVTMRAVEKFAASATLAASLLQPDGRLALLIGTAQTDEAIRLLPGLSWQKPVALPGGDTRVLLVGRAKVD
ncbi:MAG: 16S rRNA (guanine(527)-N(7))-methyltransferase RsmG [Terriglobales bacterium]